MISDHINNTPHRHVVQFYKADEPLLVTNVSRYICNGLTDGESAFIIAAAEHTATFKQGLGDAGCDVTALVKERRLLFVDAQRVMARFITDNGPDWTKFETTIQAAIDSLAHGTGLRAYGEMVGLLWQSGRFSTAIMLEDYWNRFLQARGFSLFCSYPIDVFDSEFQTCGVEALLCDHSHLLPSGNGGLDAAVSRAIDEHFGTMTEDLRRRPTEISSPYWAELPHAEATILWLRAHVPEHADRILQRARHYYQAASA